MSRARVVEADHLSLRVLKVIDIASLLGSDAFEYEVPDELEDFLSYETNALHISAAAIANALQPLGTELDAADAFERLYQKDVFGVLMQVGTPVRNHMSEDAWRCSWGHIYTGWVYGPSYDDAWELAKAWALVRHSTDLAKFTGANAMEGAAL